MTLNDLEFERHNVETRGPGVSPVPQSSSSGSANPDVPRADAAVAAKFADATALSLISVDEHGTIRFVNRAAMGLLGYRREEMIGHPVEMIIPERLRSAHAQGFSRAMSGAKLNLGGRTVEVYACRKDGSEFPIALTLCAWRDGDGMGAGAVIQDISERRERERRLLRLASQDTLTGLHNRIRFTEIVEAELSAGRPASVIMLDIDGFEDVNDTHGHAVGDSLLQAIAVRLPHLLPPKSEVARFGGDEFAVLLADVGDPAIASAEADAVLEAFKRPFEVGGQVLDIGVSVGVPDAWNECARIDRQRGLRAVSRARLRRQVDEDLRSGHEERTGCAPGPQG